MFLPASPFPTGCRHNTERVGFRREEDDRRTQQRLDKKKEEELAEERRLLRLQALRDTVKVVAEANPERLTQDTAATRAAAMEGNSARARIRAAAGEMQRFDVHGFSDDKITGDRRLRVEAALRDAGLAVGVQRRADRGRAARRQITWDSQPSFAALCAHSHPYPDTQSCREPIMPAS